MLVEAERIAQTVAAGLHGRRRAGPGETFWQHRPYAFGDPVSVIDWRQSARSCRPALYPPERMGSSGRRLSLARPVSFISTFHLPSTQCRSKRPPRRRARCRAFYSLIAGGRTHRPARRGTPPVSWTHGAITACSKPLHINAWDDAASTPPLAHLPPGARVVLLSDFFTDDFGRCTIKQSRAIAAAGATVGALVQICDPAEEDFPYQGRVEFKRPGKPRAA